MPFDIVCIWCLSQPFNYHVAIWQHEAFMMSLPAMSFGDGLRVSREGGTGGCGWVSVLRIS